MPFFNALLFQFTAERNLLRPDIRMYSNKLDLFSKKSGELLSGFTAYAHLNKNISCCGILRWFNIQSIKPTFFMKVELRSKDIAVC